MEPRFPIKERGRGERILVVQTSYLGDVVLTTPVLAELRRRFCEAEVTVLCTPEARGLLDGNPDIQEILTDDKRGKDRGFRGLWRKAEELHRRHFTIALSPHKSLRTALLLFLAGVPCRVGFRQSAGWFFYHYCVSRDSNRHDTERNLSILEPLVPDWAGCRRDLRVEVDGGTREEVRHLFSSLGVGGKARRLFFGLNPGSVWPTKRWSVQGYADLMRRLKEKYDCEILLFGGAQDRRIVAQIQRLSGFAGVDLTGRIGLRELPGALEWCDVFITNDSGPMHVAVARGHFRGGHLLRDDTLSGFLSLHFERCGVGKGAFLSSMRFPWGKALPLGNRRVYSWDRKRRRSPGSGDASKGRGYGSFYFSLTTRSSFHYALALFWIRL